LDGRCSIGFKGYSNLHDFEGSVNSRPYPVEVEKKADGSARWNVKIEVPALEMDTQNKKRDKNMQALLRVADFPVIEGTAIGLDPETFRGRTTPTALPVDLTLVGRTNSLQATVRNWQETERQILFDVEFPVSLKAFGLKPPSVLGMIRVSDRVDVVCHVVLLKP
jgi:polyisoprenoid-binding protein YceI